MAQPLLLTGLIAATFTPLFPKGEIRLEAIPAQVEFLIDQQISGLYVLGSTGEGVSLTFAERCQVAEAFVTAVAGRIPVIVQVGTESLKISQELAAHAATVGATAVSAVSPVYFKPDSARTLTASMAEIAAGAPGLPFYYYHIPGATGVNVSALDFLKLASAEIPNLGGIKFTSPLVYEYQACLEFADKAFDILWGVDEMLMSGLLAGGKAAVGSTYNFAAPIYCQLIEALKTGDLTTAQMMQSRSQQLVRTFVPYGPRGSQKAIMSLIGQDCGPTRLPVPSLDPTTTESLRKDLEAIGFFDWIFTPQALSNNP